jgi:hypothetical protein
MKIRTGIRLLVILALLVMLQLIFGGMAYATGQSSANYIMKNDVLSGGGGDMGSANYDVLSTTGQPSAIGDSSSSSYVNMAGFWHWIEVPLKNMAMPWIYLLLLGD